MSAARIYKALGDPIRLEMVQRLSRTSPLLIGEVSSDLGVTRQAARKQLEILVEAKVVKLIPKGRETEAHLDTKELTKAKRFIEGLEKLWDKRLISLKNFVESED